MEAKDTVMGRDKLTALYHDIPFQENVTDAFYITDRLERIAKAQAEISFKAGIKEVVDWLLSEGGFPWSMDEYPKRIKRWQAKLKEWGIT